MPEETPQSTTPNPAPTSTPPSKKGFKIPGLIVVVFLRGLICFGGYVTWMLYGFDWSWEGDRRRKDREINEAGEIILCMKGEVSNLDKLRMKDKRRRRRALSHLRCGQLCVF